MQRCGDAHAFRRAAPADRSPPAPGACAGGARHWGTARARLRPAWCGGGSRSACPAARAGRARACARRRLATSGNASALRRARSSACEPRIVVRRRDAARTASHSAFAETASCSQRRLSSTSARVAARHPQRQQAVGERASKSSRSSGTRPCRRARRARGDQLGTASCSRPGLPPAAPASARRRAASRCRRSAARPCFREASQRAHDAGQRAFVGDRQRLRSPALSRARTARRALEAPRWKLKSDRQCSSA